MNEIPKIPPALRICQRCESWKDGRCENEGSPHANLETGAGWTCPLWKWNKNTNPR